VVYVRNFGRPDLFIMITCNPQWQEIQSSLFLKQKATDRHDIISRVFNLKPKKLIDLIDKKEIFGEVSCYMYTIEWQKRSLPHVHLLVWLQVKVRPNDIDSVICASELQNKHKLLFIIKSTYP